MPPFSSTLEAFYSLSCSTLAVYFYRLCGPLLPPAQECNSLQSISFTHQDSQYLPPFPAIHPLVNLLVHKRSVSRCPHLKLEYPSTSNAGALCRLWKTQKAEPSCLLQQFPLPTEFGLLLLLPRGMPTSGNP